MVTEKTAAMAEARFTWLAVVLLLLNGDDLRKNR